MPNFNKEPSSREIEIEARIACWNQAILYHTIMCNSSYLNVAKLYGIKIYGAKGLYKIFNTHLYKILHSSNLHTYRISNTLCIIRNGTMEGSLNDDRIKCYAPKGVQRYNQIYLSYPMIITLSPTRTMAITIDIPFIQIDSDGIVIEDSNCVDKLVNKFRDVSKAGNILNEYNKLVDQFYYTRDKLQRISKDYGLNGTTETYGNHFIVSNNFK